MKKTLLLVLILVFGFSCSVSAFADSSKASVVICADTGEILYEKNAHTRLPMASTTKIMTALLLCEYGNLDREITVTDQMVRVEGSSMGLLADDRVTLKGLLYGMMLSSGNDAANATAITVGGSIDRFVALMNKRAKELGLRDTNFETPSGLDSDNHYTTAYELALITRTALKNPDFLKAASSQTAVLNYGNPPYLRYLTNHNRLLKSYGDVIGVKTGFTKKSGRCLVSAARRDGKTVIAVTLNDKDDWADHRELLDLGLDSVTSEILSPKTDKDTVNLASGDKIKIEIPKSEICYAQRDKIRCRISLPSFVYLPISEGQIVGKAEYFFEDTLIKTEDITVKKGAEYKKASKKTRFINILKVIISKI